MTAPRPPTTRHPVEAAADRVMHLWSLIRMVPDHELSPLRSSLLENLSELQHLTEDELVIVGLKYLHQNVQWKSRNDPSVLRDRVLKLIIFDFDGTLVDSRSLILESHQIVFSEFQLPAPSSVDSLALVGKSLDVILTQLAGPTAPILEMVRAYDLLLPQLRADPAFAEKPFDGVGDLLYELSSTSNTILGVATGHRSDTIAPALEALRWTGFFRTIQAADMAPSKPHPAMLLQALAATGVTPNNSIFIGDTTFDMEMAQAARLRSIGVGWGYHQSERLMAAGAHRVVQTVDQLRRCIRSAMSE